MQAGMTEFVKKHFAAEIEMVRADARKALASDDGAIQVMSEQGAVLRRMCQLAQQRGFNSGFLFGAVSTLGAFALGWLILR